MRPQWFEHLAGPTTPSPSPSPSPCHPHLVTHLITLTRESHGHIQGAGGGGGTRASLFYFIYFFIICDESVRLYCVRVVVVVPCCCCCCCCCGTLLLLLLLLLQEDALLITFQPSPLFPPLEGKWWWWLMEGDNLFWPGAWGCLLSPLPSALASSYPPPPASEVHGHKSIWCAAEDTGTAPHAPWPLQHSSHGRPGRGGWWGLRACVCVCVWRG